MYFRELLNISLIIALDASFVNNKEIRYFSYSYIISLFSGFITWKVVKQNIIIILTIKVEIKGVELTAKEIISL
jgi:hypothetical protein